MNFVFLLKEIGYIIDICVYDHIIEAVNKLSLPYFFVEPANLYKSGEKYNTISLCVNKVSKDFLLSTAHRIITNEKPSHRMFNYAYWLQDGENTVIIDDYSYSSVIVCNIEKKEIYFNYYSDELVPYDLTRFLRNMYVYSRSRILDAFHGAALESPPYSFIFTGEKFAGKTTTLTYLLKENDYSFISNDVVLLGDKICEGVGKAVSVRHLTVDELGLNIPVLKYPYNKNPENKFSKIKMSAKEYCDLVGAKLTNQGHSIGACFYITSTPDSSGIIQKLTDSNQIQLLINKQMLTINYFFPFENCGTMEKKQRCWYKNVDFFLVEMPYCSKVKVLENIKSIIKEIVSDA